MELSRRTIKRGIILSVSVSIVALILVMVLTQNELTFKSFSRVNTVYLVIATLIMLTFWILKALKLKVLTHVLGGKVSTYKVFTIYLASAFVSHVTPSTSGGLPFQIYFLHREGLPLGKTTALTVLDGIITFLFFYNSNPLFTAPLG